MPIHKINKECNDGAYFLTFTIRNWVKLLDKHNRWDILANSLAYCQKSKGLQISSFVFMKNHIHLIVYSPDTAGFIRDFKRFTSKNIKLSIQLYEPALLKEFETEGNFSLWKPGSKPKEIYGNRFFKQKVNYIHMNPVTKGYVNEPEEWYWSSANEGCVLKPND